MKHRVLICGGRHYCDVTMFCEVMTHLSQWFAADFCIIQGDATGADALAKAWGLNRGVPVIGMPAAWTYYRKRAGSVRNSWMLKYAIPDLVVAFPGGPGTADMVRQARKAGIDVFEVKN